MVVAESQENETLYFLLHCFIFNSKAWRMFELCLLFLWMWIHAWLGSCAVQMNMFDQPEHKPSGCFSSLSLFPLSFFSFSVDTDSLSQPSSSPCISRVHLQAKSLNTWLNPNWGQTLFGRGHILTRVRNQKTLSQSWDHLMTVNLCSLFSHSLAKRAVFTTVYLFLHKDHVLNWIQLIKIYLYKAALVNVFIWTKNHGRPCRDESANCLSIFQLRAFLFSLFKPFNLALTLQ